MLYWQFLGQDQTLSGLAKNKQKKKTPDLHLLIQFIFKYSFGQFPTVRRHMHPLRGRETACFLNLSQDLNPLHFNQHRPQTVRLCFSCRLWTQKTHADGSECHWRFVPNLLVLSVPRGAKLYLDQKSYLWMINDCSIQMRMLNIMEFCQELQGCPRAIYSHFLFSDCF